uniref:Uncharacterized protein n=1 Tax=Kalanchoe fedtschenkoi TaxID=63787 RepID=A0A7N0T7D0_KALFE
MMDPRNGVLDISSDEEPDGNDQQMNLQWLCDQLFNDADDDSDDVVVVGEVFNSKQGVKRSSSPVAENGNDDENKVQEGDEGDDDDDCVILDGDPDKMVSVEDDQDNGSDELVVVGEKGQVACRDYPHPRHLCVKYPFSSTLHKFHCELCHCYVCDIVAPCNIWGNGMNIGDHCHATDKQDLWKIERKNFKLKRCSSLPAIKMSENTASLVPPPVMSEIGNAAHPLTRSFTMPNNHVAVRPVPASPAVHTFPATNLGAPNTIGPGSGINRFPHSPVTQQLPVGSTFYDSRKVRYQNTQMLGPQHAVFKRMKTRGVNRHVYRPAYSQQYAPVQSYAPTAAWNQPLSIGSANTDHHPNKWVNLGFNMSTGPVHNPLPPSHYGSTLSTSSAAYQYATSNQPIAATMGTQNLNQRMNFPSNMTSSLPNVSVPWIDNTNSSSRQLMQPLPAELASLPNVSVPQADNTNSTSRQWHQHPQTDTSIQNVPALGADNQNSRQLNQGVQAEAMGSQGLEPVNAASNQYLPSDQSGKGSSLALESDTQTSVIPELENFHFEFEEWLMENQPVVSSPMSEPPIFSEQNILSPDDAHIDSNLLYDEWRAMTSVADM